MGRTEPRSVISVAHSCSTPSLRTFAAHHDLFLHLPFQQFARYGDRRLYLLAGKVCAMAKRYDVKSLGHGQTGVEIHEAIAGYCRSSASPLCFELQRNIESRNRFPIAGQEYDFVDTVFVAGWQRSLRFFCGLRYAHRGPFLIGLRLVIQIVDTRISGSAVFSEALYLSDRIMPPSS